MGSRDYRFLLPSPIRSPLGSITLAGHLRKRGPDGWTKPRVFGSYAVVILKSGGGIYEDVRGMRHAVEPGDVIWVFPELGHIYGPPEGGNWEEFYTVFTGSVFDLLRRAGVIDPARAVWRVGDVRKWIASLKIALRPATSAGEALRRVLALQNLIVELSLTQQDDVFTELAWVKEACRRIEAEPRGIHWAALAASLHVSYETFRKKFKAHTGHSPGNYRLSVLIDRACALLLHTGSSLKEIAAETGFADEFHFSKAFKQRVGLAPSVFRATAHGRNT